MNGPAQALHAPPTLRILRMPELERKVGLKKTQIYELINRQEFPKGVKLSKHATGWLEHEVDEFLTKRIAARDAEGMEENSGASVGATS